MKRTLLLTILILANTGLITAQNRNLEKEAARAYPDYLFEATKVMVYDVINPAAAARYYAYACLAGYFAEQAHATDPDHDFSRRLHGYANLDYRPGSKSVPALASTYAMLEVSRQMLPSGEMLTDVLDQLVTEYGTKHKLSKKAVAASIQTAQAIASHILAYSKTDHFNELSAKIGYTPKPGPGYWYPTPPAYMGAVEPHWNTVRTFILDSASQFTPEVPTPFDMDVQSKFYKDQLMGVYQAVRDLTPEQREIASFWDCNPFAVEMTGHMAIGFKKITPGGHWMSITGIACKKEGHTLGQTLKAHALVALALHDGFVSCWDEKYRSERIRPETVINQHLDASWRPILQTPPFPEYTSGHSVISSAAATVLTALFSDNYRFTDNTQIFFGLPEREFSSFEAAAEEAAISRVYGGIHYMDSCENGVKQGKAIGDFIVQQFF